MATKVIFNLCILILFTLFVLARVGETRPTEDSNTLDPVVNKNNNESWTFTKKVKNCSVVVGGALAGGVIGPLAIGIPLVLCLCGVSCWGIMARLIAVCCKSCIRKVPGGNCFESMISGGGILLIKIACIVGIPIGLIIGGYYTNTYTKYHCFGST